MYIKPVADARSIVDVLELYLVRHDESTHFHIVIIKDRTETRELAIIGHCRLLKSARKRISTPGPLAFY